MPRLIDANTVVTIQIYNDMTENTDTKKMTIAEAIDEWSDEGCPPTVDVVPKADYDHLLKRFKHLIQSDYIKSFDAWDSRKNDYVLDIRDAEPVVRCKDCKKWETINCPFARDFVKWDGFKFCAWGERKEDE